MQKPDDDGGDQPVDLGATRSPDQLQLDARKVLGQREALLPTRTTRAFQAEVTVVLDRRRDSVPGAEQFDVVHGPADEPSGGTPVLRGALLVRARLRDVQPELFEEVKQAVGQVGEPELRLEGELLVLTGAVEATELVALARRVRAAGYEASVTHIVPLGPIVKGENGPAATSTSTTVTPRGGAGTAVAVAVIDTGVPPIGKGHDWQAGLLTPDNLDPLDAFPGPDGDDLLDAAAGHGAFATGVVQQVAPGAQIAVHTAVDSDGVGSELRVAEALLRAVDAGAEIVNLSLGAQTVDDQPLLALQVAFELMERRGGRDVLLVAAAGNYGDSRPCWPAAFRRVVSVAGLSDDMRPAPWSSRGFWVDVCVVAEGVVSTYVVGKESPELSGSTPPDEFLPGDGGPLAVWSGTSFGAPQLVGAVARRLAEQRAAGDTSATPHSALAELLAGAPRIPDFGVALRILSGTPVSS